MHYLAMHIAQAALIWSVIAITAYGIGSRVRNHYTGPYGKIVGFACALAFWTILGFACATLSILGRTTTIIAVVFVCLAAIARRLRCSPTATTSPQPCSSLQNDVLPIWIAWSFWLPVGLSLLIVAARSMWPHAAWDAQTYHLTAVKHFLAHGGFHRVPWNVYTNWPMNTELLFCFALSCFDFIAAKAIHLAFFVLLLTTLYCGARRELGYFAACCACALLCCNDVLLYVIGLAYVDCAYAFYLLLACLLVHRGIEEGEQSTIILGGIICGLATGCKLSGAFAPLVLICFAARGRTWKRNLVLCLVPCSLVALPWVIKTAILTGNPVYPFCYEFFGGPEWNQALSNMLSKGHPTYSSELGPLVLLSLPFELILSVGPRAHRFIGILSPAWLLIVPLALWHSRRCALTARCLLGAFVFYIGWTFTSLVTRLLIPILPLLSLAGAAALAALIRKPRLRAITCLAAMALVLSATLPWQGVSIFSALIRLPVTAAATAGDPVFSHINHTLPPHARILLINTNWTFFCARQTIADSFHEAPQVHIIFGKCTTRDEVQSALDKHEITHLLVRVDQQFEQFLPYALRDYVFDIVRTKHGWRSPTKRFILYELGRTASPAAVQ